MTDRIQQPGECCSNCIEGNDPGFGGACSYAGEISSNFWCEHYIDVRTREGKAILTYYLALEAKGIHRQMDKLVEEMSELTKAIMKTNLEYHNDNYNYNLNLLEEIGHVELALECVHHWLKLQTSPGLDAVNSDRVAINLREQRLIKWFDVEMKNAQARAENRSRGL